MYADSSRISAVHLYREYILLFSRLRVKLNVIVDVDRVAAHCNEALDKRLCVAECGGILHDDNVAAFIFVPELLHKKIIARNESVLHGRSVNDRQPYRKGKEEKYHRGADREHLDNIEYGRDGGFLFFIDSALPYRRRSLFWKSNSFLKLRIKAVPLCRFRSFPCVFVHVITSFLFDHASEQLISVREIIVYGGAVFFW